MKRWRDPDRVGENWAEHAANAFELHKSGRFPLFFWSHPIFRRRSSTRDRGTWFLTYSTLLCRCAGMLMQYSTCEWEVWRLIQKNFSYEHFEFPFSQWIFRNLYYLVAVFILYPRFLINWLNRFMRLIYG